MEHCEGKSSSIGSFFLMDLEINEGGLVINKNRGLKGKRDGKKAEFPKIVSLQTFVRSRLAAAMRWCFSTIERLHS